MKSKIWILGSVLLTGAQAWAGAFANLECRIYSSQSSIPSRIRLQSGMRQEVVCDRISCPDSKDWEIVMNYNGNGYEDIYVEAGNRVTGEYASTKAEAVKAGSSIEFGLFNRKTDKFLAIVCDVLSVE